MEPFARVQNFLEHSDLEIWSAFVVKGSIKEIDLAEETDRKV